MTIDRKVQLNLFLISVYVYLELSNCQVENAIQTKNKVTIKYIRIKKTNPWFSELCSKPKLLLTSFLYLTFCCMYLKILLIDSDAKIMN